MDANTLIFISRCCQAWLKENDDGTQQCTKCGKKY